MDLILVTSSDQMDQLLSNLSNIRLDLINSRKNLELLWHTSRILQSITNPLIEKTIYTDCLKKTEIVFLHFERIEKTKYQNVEMWIDFNDVSQWKYGEFIEYLMRFCRKYLDENIYVAFRSFPLRIVEKLRLELFEKYKIRVAFYIELTGRIKPEKVDKNLYQSKTKQFEMIRIPESEVENVHKNWYYSVACDVEWMRNSLKNRLCFGLKDKSNDKLIAQYMFMITGTFGALNIDKEYRGMGLSKWLVAESTNLNLDAGYDILVEIDENNSVSKKLYESLCFEKATKLMYVALDNIDSDKIKHRFDL